jgi:hypothetical protein
MFPILWSKEITILPGKIFKLSPQMFSLCIQLWLLLLLSLHITQLKQHLPFAPQTYFD